MTTVSGERPHSAKEHVGSSATQQRIKLDFVGIAFLRALHK